MLNVQQLPPTTPRAAQQLQNLIDFEQNDSGYIGLFLRHRQNFDWFDNDFNRQIHYELNSKLFAINEPYLMKTERDSLMKLKKMNEESANMVDDKKKSNGTLRKRKKNLDKKLALLDGNFGSTEEKIMATNLIERYLIINDESDGGCNGGKKNAKKTLLKSINLKEMNSNLEAQSFVDSLFCNRFESLNYRTKLLCNPFSKTIKAKFGLSNFLIPPRCSFAGIDVIDGVKMLTRYLKRTSIDMTSSSKSLICTRNPFIFIMDPAWDNNKSVKRKRTYETVSLDYMRRLCKESRILLDLIDSLRQSCPTQKMLKKPSSTSIVCAIWTTNLDKDFVIDEMLPSLNLRLSHVLKWHKVTKIGLPVKVHGGQEYLILATKSSKNNNDDQISSKNNNNNIDNHKNGIIVSIPSAIHSHKPSIMPIIHRLFDFNHNDFGDIHPDLTLHCSMSKCSNVETAAAAAATAIKNDDNDLNNHYWLVANEFINYLCGIELFARYLQTGFHSIGYECIKLQNEKLFGHNDDC
ncbi:Methyltransferase-like protein 4 [Dermatophagoides pteronyssinus]|uniref:Methyltransferase-like protein 4 n=1 Tax=Dermatophagoides pteronyssinus TaxID=6956 RepID=A0ABQ8J9Q8_DERPT|nr:Methyltransferase-like protein 4 [Dermatophagoides pteronyssinus]